jgi:hypothetical protein
MGLRRLEVLKERDFNHNSHMIMKIPVTPIKCLFEKG